MAGLFTIAKTLRQHKHLLIGDRINKQWYFYVLKYEWEIKKKILCQSNGKKDMGEPYMCIAKWRKPT